MDLKPASYRAVINGQLALLFIYMFSSLAPQYAYIFIALMTLIFLYVFYLISKYENFNSFQLFPKWLLITGCILFIVTTWFILKA